MFTAHSKKIRRRLSLRNESGQSLIIVALAIFVVVGFAALAIDTATWYQKHHQSQVAADAAALAAANCLAYSGSGKTCTSTTDTADAIAVATTYAKNNGVTIPASDVSFDNPTYPSEITVTTPNSGRALFAGVFGITSGTQVAKSTATWKSTSSDCSSAGTGCDLIFANNSSCSGGVTLTTNGSPPTIEGGIQSEGSITSSYTGNPSWSSKPTYQTGCSGPSTSSTQTPWTSPAHTQSLPSDYPNDWPVDYRDYYPACPGYSELTDTEISCTGPSGTPSYCTEAGSSFSNPTTANQVYCAYGTGTPANPATWNGSITQNNTIAATYIGGTVSISNGGNGTVSPAPGNHLLAYAAESGSSALSVNMTGTTSLEGDMFAPFGTATVSLGGTPSGAGIFIEAFDVNFSSNGTPSAAGPADNASGQPPPAPSDALLN